MDTGYDEAVKSMAVATGLWWRLDTMVVQCGFLFVCFSNSLGAFTIYTGFGEADPPT
jgi:hypothetical protein